MKEYEVVDTDADNIGDCGICRYTSGKNEGRRRKLDWLKERRELDHAERADLDRAMDHAFANLPAGYQWLKSWEYV